MELHEADFGGFMCINAKYICPIRYNRLAREWTEKYAML